MKDPAFLFYSQDFLVGTLAMPFEERGRYITLMCYQHQTGRMSEETIRLLIGSFSDMLRLKFKQDEKGLFYNDRLEIEIEKRNKFTESRVNNGKLGGRPQNKNNLNKTDRLKIDKPKNNLIENEDVNENSICSDTKLITETFENFRKQYPGTKGGFEVEYKNFIKKCKIEDIEYFIPALNKEKIHKKKLKELKMFCPEWKNLSTWINQKCWMQELTNLESNVNDKVERIPMTTVGKGMTAEEYMNYGLKPEYRS